MFLIHIRKGERGREVWFALALVLWGSGVLPEGDRGCIRRTQDGPRGRLSTAGCRHLLVSLLLPPKNLSLPWLPCSLIGFSLLYCVWISQVLSIRISWGGSLMSYFLFLHSDFLTFCFLFEWNSKFLLLVVICWNPLWVSGSLFLKFVLYSFYFCGKLIIFCGGLNTTAHEI